MSEIDLIYFGAIKIWLDSKCSRSKEVCIEDAKDMLVKVMDNIYNDEEDDIDDVF